MFYFLYESCELETNATSEHQNNDSPYNDNVQVKTSILQLCLYKALNSLTDPTFTAPNSLSEQYFIDSILLNTKLLRCNHM